MDAELEAVDEHLYKPHQSHDHEMSAKIRAWRPRCFRPWHRPNRKIEAGDLVEHDSGVLAFVVSTQADSADVWGRVLQVRMQGELVKRPVARRNVRSLCEATPQSLFDVGEQVLPRLCAYQYRTDSIGESERRELAQTITSIRDCMGESRACEVVDHPELGVVRVAVVGLPGAWQLPQSALRTCAPRVALMINSTPYDIGTLLLHCFTMVGVEVASVLANLEEPLPQTLWAEAAECLGLPLHRITFVLPNGQTLMYNARKLAGSLGELLEA
jgi:hypothetical protein